MATIKVKRTTGSTTPTGLTFGEPAYVQGLRSLYIGQTAGDPAIRIGAEVTTDNTFGSASDNKIPTQLAVKTYVDNNVAGGAVTTLNGLTGAVFIGAGTGIQLAAAGKGITVTNIGVQSAVAGSGIAVSGATGAVTFINTGVTGLVAGTAISISGSTGNITVTNTGVQSIAGTSNQITASGSTGAVTLSLPSALTVPGSLNVTTDLTVTGNLTINGNTTTVNSNVMVVDDPIITLGLSGGLPITVSDAGKDRGVAFTYFDSTGKTGFFGYDASGSRFVFAGEASVSNEVVSATTFSPVQASNIIVTESTLKNTVTIAPTSGAANNPTYTLPDWSTGKFIIASDEGTNSNYILKSNGLSVPTWINPNSAGFTAFTTTNVSLAVDTTDTETFLVFSQVGATGNQQLRYNAGLTYNAVSNSLKATTFVGALSGNATTATTATNATNVAMLTDSSDTLAYVTFVNAASDTNQAVKYNSGLTYNAVSNALSATTFIGALSGNATTATTLQTARTIGITGDVWGSASFNGSADINITATIQANSIVLGTDTTGQYASTIASSGSGLSITSPNADDATAYTISLTKINSGIDFGTFAFTTSEFTNNGSGTVAIGTVDGGSF